MSKEIISYHVIYRPIAEVSLFNIAFYISTNGYPDNAIKFYKTLIDFGDSLGFFPNKYTACRHKSFVKRKYRCAVFSDNYVFVYKLEKAQVVILNVIHSMSLR